MKKFFALITAALMSVSVFASKDVVPSDDVLAGYYGEGQVCVCIFVPADMACNDIVLTGSFNGWLSTAADCPAFVAVEGYDGWYVAAFNPEAEPDAEKGIQAKPVMLDVDGNFNWEYQVGAATVIRGGVTVVQGAYAGEIDLFYYGTDAPNVFTVDQWKQNPCTAIYHNYTITVISDGCDGNAVPYLIGVMNNWTFQQMELDADKTAENKAPTYTVSFKVAEGSSYQIVSGLKDESGEIVEEPAWSENSYLQKLVDNEWVRIPGEDGDNLLTHENASILWDLRDDTLRWARCDESPLENVILAVRFPTENCPEAVEVIGSFDEWVGTPMEYIAATGYYIAQFTAMSWDYFKFRSAGSWEQEIEIYNPDYSEWARITDNQCKFGNLWEDDSYQGEPVKLIELDWSDPDTYRWVSDSAPQKEVTLWLGNVLVGTGTDTGQECQAEPFRTSDYNKEMFAGLQMGDLIMIDTENADNSRYMLYYWAAADSNWVQLSENDGVYKDSTIIYIKVESEDVAQSIADNGIIVMGTCFNIVKISAYCTQCKASSETETEQISDTKLKIDGIFYNIDTISYTAEVTYEGDDQYNSNPERYIGEVVIPESITFNNQTFTVTSIGEYSFRSCENLTAVHIPNTVTTIQYNAFQACSSLTSITFPDSVTFIGWAAFQGCSALTSIFLPKAVTHVEGYTFAGCASLTSIIVEEGNEIYDSRDNCNAIIETATNTLVAGCQTTIIPGGIQIIGHEAFTDCTWLPSISLPNSVTAIGYNAFQGCNNVTSINIPSGLTSIESAALDCASSVLESIVVEEGNPIYDSRDNCNALIETATNKLILGCNSSFVPEGIDTIDGYAFNGCARLTSLVIPNSVRSLGSTIFQNCRNLSSVILSESLTEIPNWTFTNCSSLSKITIPSSVTRVGEYAFYNCMSLQSITCEASTPPSMGDDVFLYAYKVSSQGTLYVPAESIDLYAEADQWNSFANIRAIDSTFTIPTVADLAQSYDLQNNVVLCCYFDETPCNTVILTGSFNEWSSEPEECLKFNPLEGYEGWWVAEAPYAEDFSAKPVQLKSDGSFSWDYQAGDAEAWIYKGGNVADVEQGYDGEANISYPSAGAYIYEIAYWKNHKTPCDESKTHNYTLVLYDPFCEEHPEFTPCVAGGFNSWTFTSLERSAAGDSAWMVVVEAEEGSSYKFAESTIGWNNEFQYYDATEDQWMYFGNYEFPAASDDTTLIFDFSNLEYFRYAQCAAATTSGICGDSLTWELSDGVLVIRGTGAMYDYIMENAPWSKELTTVIMEEGVTSIGAQAFTECANLTSVSIPSTVTTMGVFAFSDCSSLQSIYLGDNLTKIPTAAFQSCTNLTEVMLGDKVTVIGESAFNSCSSLSSINIPNSVTTIETGVFNYCNSLSAIIIPESVTTIGDWALAECNSLTAIIVDDNNANYSSIDGVLFSKDVSELIQCPAGIQGDFTIPEDVTELGLASFAGCYGLTSIFIPNTVVSIDSMAFHGCRSLQSIEIPDNVTYMGINLFNACQSMTSVTLGSGTTHLGQYFFSWCSSLTTITCRAQIPPTFGEDVFMGVENPITVYVPEESIEAYQSAEGWSDFTIRAIGTEPVNYEHIKIGDLYYNLYPDSLIAEVTYEYQWTMENYDDIRFLQIPSSVSYNDLEFQVTRIGDYAFWTCDSLITVSIPESIEHIGNMAFYSCESIAELELPSNLQSVGEEAFAGLWNIKSLDIPSSVSYIGDKAFSACTSLPAFEVSPDNMYYSSVDGVLFDKQQTTLMQYPAGSSATAYSIPNTVTIIADEAFDVCRNLVDVDIPESVTTIGSHAFYHCNDLASIEIPEGVTVIHNQTFNSCYRMKTLKLPSTLTRIEYGAFYFCAGLSTLTIPANVTWLADGAFGSCDGLNSITCEAITPPVFEEEGDAFSGIDKSLPLYVPEQSIEAYQSAEGWSKFSNIKAIGTEPLAVQYYLVGSGEELGRWLLEKALPMDSGVIVLNLPVNAYEFKVLVGELSWDNLMGYESVNHDCSSEGLEEGTSGNVKFTLTQESEVIIAVVDGMLCVQGNFGGTVEVTGYSVVGDSALVGADWDTSFTQTEMTRQEDGTWTYTIPSITLAAGDYLYKFAANHTWAVEQYPDDMDNYVLTIEKSGIYSVTFTLVPGEGGTASVNMIEDLTPEENLTGVCGENLTWELKDSVLTILGTGAMSWEEYAPWRDYAERITTIELPEGLTNIYNQAFYGCANLKNVTIPNSVERIEDSAFMGCSSMTSIVIPESVDTIGQFAFRECKSLISVTINSDAVAGTDYVSIYITSMSDLFGKQLEEVIFGESVTSIGKNALYYSSVSVCNLRSVTIPNSVTEIGSRAFYNCASLESLNVPESVTTIGEDAFRRVNVWYNGNAAGSPWGAKCLNGNCDLYPVAIDVQDGSLSDWDNLPAEYVFETTCPEDASLQGLKSVKVYADQTYINLLVEPNMNVITDLSWVPFHVIINTDNSDMTGGYGYEFMDANADILLEGSVFSDGEPILYNPAVYKWWGEVGGTDFQWSDPDVEPSADNYWGAIVGEGMLPIGNSQYVDGKFEIQLLRELIPSDAGWNENEFGIGFDIQQSWESVGILPLVSPTDDNPNGYTQKLQVKISDVVVNPSDTVEVTVYSVIGDSALVGAEWDVDNTLTEMTQQDDGTWTYAIPSVALDSGYYAYKFVSNHSWSGEQYPDESHNYVLNIEQTGNYFVLFTLVSGEGGTAVATLLEDSIPETDTIPTIIRVQIDGLYYYLNDSTRTAEVTAEIEYSADNYKDLTEANIPESVIYLRKEYSVTSIGDNAFYGCVTLSSVSLPNNLTNIGSMAFFNCSITSVNIPWAVASIGQQAFVSCSSLDSITVDSQNKVYDSRNNCNAIIETATSTLIVGCWNTTIPDNVIVIGNQAFSGCSDLETITIPNSVVSLGDESFYGCTSMTSVTIPESVTQIGTSAFAYDSKLTSITSMAMTPPTLGKTVFEDVDKSIPLYVHKSSIESYQAANGWNEFENILFRSIEDTVITCGPEFEWHEMILTESGDYEFELEDGTIHILHLTLIQTIEQTDSITIYDNDSLIWHDRVLYETGTYCDTIRSQQADCDSLIICLELTVLPYIPPTVTIFGQEVEVTDPSDSTIIVDEVDILGDSSLIYSTSDNTLTLNETLMEAGDSVSAAISYTGTDPLTIVLNDSSTIFADTIIASTSDIIITGDGTLLVEGTVPIIGVPEANITFDSVSMVVRSLPSAAAVRRRIKGGKRLDETGGPALSGFGSTDFNKVEVSPSDAMYGPVNTGGSDVLSALYVLNAYGEQEFVTEFTLTAKADTPDAVESVTTGQASAIRKVLQDGQLLIIRGNDTFNIVGVRVQ